MTSVDVSTIWHTRCAAPTPVGIAARLGYLDESFREAGVTLKSVVDSPDSAVRQSHFDHTLDWSFRHGGNVPAIRARSEGRRTRLIGVTWTDEFQAILTLPETGVRTILDLEGRRFGLPRRPPGIVDFMRASALKGLQSALSLEGLRIEDVEIVDIPADSVLPGQDGPALFGLTRRQAYGEEIAALIRGDVEAIYVKGTAGIAVANLIGAIEVVEIGFHPDPMIRINAGSPRVLTVDERLADERPDLVARLLDTIFAASAWARTHPDEVRRLVAVETGASEEQVLAAHGPNLHRRLGLGLEPELVAAVGHFKDFLRDFGFIAADFDVAQWIDRRPLDRFDALESERG